MLFIVCCLFNTYIHVPCNVKIVAMFLQHDELKPLTKSFTDSLSELGNLKVNELTTIWEHEKKIRNQIAEVTVWYCSLNTCLETTAAPPLRLLNRCLGIYPAISLFDSVFLINLVLFSYEHGLWCILMNWELMEIALLSFKALLLWATILNSRGRCSGFRRIWHLMSMRV